MKNRAFGAGTAKKCAVLVPLNRSTTYRAVFRKHIRGTALRTFGKNNIQNLRDNLSCLSDSNRIANPNIPLGSDSMMCHECECKYGNSTSDDYRACDWCGQRFWYEGGDWIENYFLCPDCLERETFICEECGERHFNSDRKYDKVKEKFVCNDCYEEEEE